MNLSLYAERAPKKQTAVLFLDCSVAGAVLLCSKINDIPSHDLVQQPERQLRFSFSSTQERWECHRLVGVNSGSHRRMCPRK